MSTDNNGSYVMIYNKTRQVLRGKASTLAVYAELRSHITPARRHWFGKRKELAAGAGVTERTFDSAVKTLTELGLIEVQYRFAPSDWDKKDSSKIGHVHTKDTPIQLANRYVVYDMPNHINAVHTGRNNCATPLANIAPPPSKKQHTDIYPLEEDPKEGTAPSHEPPTVFDGLGELANTPTNNTLEIYPDHCPAHQRNPHPPACHDCRKTRIANEARAEALKQDEATRKHTKEQQRRAGIRTCTICDPIGRRPYINPRTGVESETQCHHTDQDRAEADEARAANTATTKYEIREVS